MNETEKKEVVLLRSQIHLHDHLYYVKDSPKISDRAYDTLYHRLKELEGKYPECVTSDSPTQRVGGKVDDRFRKVVHPVPMLSLDNTFSVDEVRVFHQRVVKGLADIKANSIEYVVELKFDGLAVSLTYEDGKLVRGATRGDGVKGEDVTANLKTIRSIPLEISLSKKIEVRGEVYMPRKEFQRLNALREDAGESPFANPRNAYFSGFEATSTICHLNPRVKTLRTWAALGPVLGAFRGRPLKKPCFLEENRFAKPKNAHFWGFKAP